jgi:hypothetical protein
VTPEGIATMDPAPRSAVTHFEKSLPSGGASDIYDPNGRTVRWDDFLRGSAVMSLNLAIQWLVPRQSPGTSLKTIDGLLNETESYALRPKASIWRRISQLTANAPISERKKLPKDAAAQIDRYLYNH